MGSVMRPETIASLAAAVMADRGTATAGHFKSLFSLFTASCIPELFYSY